MADFGAKHYRFIVRVLVGSFVIFAGLLVFRMRTEVGCPPDNSEIIPDASRQRTQDNREFGVDDSIVVSGENSATSDATALSGDAAIEQLKAKGQFGSLNDAIRAARYAAEKIPPDGPHSRRAEFFASNPKQQLRAWFGVEGLELASGFALEANKEPWRFKMSLAGVGRDDSPDALPNRRTVSGNGNRVEIVEAAGGIVEHYENRPDGIEQSFTLQRRPLGNGGDLHILLNVEGGLRPASSENGDEIRFRDSDGRDVLKYSHLKVWDADGRMLSSRLEAKSSTVALIVADAGARYPITVDPLFANVEARLVDDLSAGDQFGRSVALSGDTALIGAPLDDTPAGADAGSAYVLIRSGNQWRHQAKLTATDGAADDTFGSFVSLVGDSALVGAPYGDGLEAANAGSAYVFTRTGNTWSQQAKLTASDAAADDSFGASVSIGVDTALVGSPSDDTTVGLDAGSAYVFVRTGTVWSQQAKLAPADAATGDSFGFSVSLSGETALIGAPNDDVTSGVNAGSGYVFLRSGTNWSQQAKLFAPDGAPADQFGFAVALDGNSALLGAPFGPGNPGNDNNGRAYIFIRSGVSWSHQQMFPPAIAVPAGIGKAVALSGDTAALGALIYVRSGTTWSKQNTTSLGVSASNGGVGSAVAISGESVILGAPLFDTSSGVDAGSAYILLNHPGSSPPWQIEAQLTANDATAGDLLGTAVAMSGSTIIVGAPSDDSVAGTDSGCAFVFVRTGPVWAQQARLYSSEFDNAARNQGFGSAVAIEGDTALVGAPFGFQTGVLAGNAYVFVRNGTTWSQQSKLSATDGSDGDSFGQAVALKGDTLIVGAPYKDAFAGSAYIFARSGTIWTQQAKLNNPEFPQHTFGFSVALGADVAMIGAPSANNGEEIPSVFEYVRTGTSWTRQARLVAGDTSLNFMFGYSIAMNGTTLLIGAPRYISEHPNAGSVYVLTKGSGAWTQQAKLLPNDGVDLDRFGHSVALSGDTAVVGSPLHDSSFGSNSGCAYIFSRTGNLWSQQLKLTAGVDASVNDEFGAAVTISGDNVLVGARKDDGSGIDAGSAYIFLLGEFPSIVTQPVSRTSLPGQTITFSVVATGYGPLQYQWRKNGVAIPGAAGPTFTIPSAALSDVGLYDVVVSNAGGVATSAPASLAVNALSQFTQTTPLIPAEAQGFLIVNITPSGIGAGWRFVGEQLWRNSGTAVAGLTTSDREIEFRPVAGYHQPSTELVSITSGGAATVFEGEYAEVDGTGGTGGMIVLLKPDSLTASGLPVPERAQWRLLGEDDTTWRESGTLLDGLRPGSYLVESKSLAGRTTPRPLTVNVGDGQTVSAVATYFLADTTTGTGPSVLPFETVTESPTMPYQYVGQFRTDAGSGSGFVVRARVVATAAHMVFDDGTLSAATGQQWLFQRDRASYEAAPQTPRGFYIFTGYAAQRTVENTPGTSSPDSQTLDAAALYFLADAGRAGFGGYLASDSTPNEWLSSPALKTLVGYPVTGISANNQGRMHATPPMNVAFTHSFGRTYTTAQIRSSGGNSGGPLCVQFENGSYYPAAIYLGGTGQTVVRVIDSDVIEMFNRAEVSGNGGDNNTGGGITHTNSPISGSTTGKGAIKVNITPAAAAATARWKLSDTTTVLRTTGSTVANKTPGGYKVYLTDVPGYVTPTSPYSVTLSANTLTTVSADYLLTQSITFPTIADRLLEQSPVTLGASASSGLAVSYTVVSGPATRSGSTLTLTGYGAVTIRATQAGNGSYAAAANVTRTFDVLALTPTSWTTQSFSAGEQANALISGPLADPDGDGICNLLEFALNLAPKTNARVQMQPDTGTSGLPAVQRNPSGNLTIEFVRRKASISPGVTYAVEFASDAAGPWATGGTEVSTSIDATFERVKVTDSSSGPRRLARVKITAP